MPKPIVVMLTPRSAARSAMRASSGVLVMPMLGWPSENRITWLTCHCWNALNTSARPGEHAAREVGAAAVAQRADAGDRRGARGRVDDHRRHRLVDAVGEGDHRDAVTVAQLRDERLGGDQHVAERRPRHRPRAVEHQRHVQRRERRRGRPPAHADRRVEQPAGRARRDAAVDVDRRRRRIVGDRLRPLGRRRHREHHLFAEVLQPRRLRQADEDAGATARRGGERVGARATARRRAAKHRDDNRVVCGFAEIMAPQHKRK